MEKAHERFSRRNDDGIVLSRKIFLVAIFLLHSALLISQPVLTSAIRGTVTDRYTGEPLAGATIILLDHDPLIGTTTDSAGRFRLPGVPIGQQRLKITFVGYSPFITETITVSSSRDAQLTIGLEEMVITGQEVEIRGDYRKYEAINKMASIGVRSFSVDETSRFAGSYNDPARMAQNFAGVTSGVDNRNDIIVRGNSPMGLQWRLDDMEIPNPNHFAAMGTTGGPVTVLNNNLLTNSDFFTGTFPAQYGNAMAGIFDMRMRNGNSGKREYWFGISWNGLEFGTEGPFSKKNPASYLFSYRYSLLELVSLTGIKMDVVPRYQDINLKITIPAKKAGVFTVTGIGGKSYIELYDSKKEQGDWMFPDYGEDLSNGSDLGVIGITHQIFPSGGFQLKNMIYLVASDVYTRIDTFSNVVTTPSPWAGEYSSEVKTSYHSSATFKTGKLTMEAGLTADYYFLNYHDSVMKKGSFLVNTNSAEEMLMLRGYLQVREDLSAKVSLTGGIHYSWLNMNNTSSVDARLGLNWDISRKHRIHLGGGTFSQMQPRVIYFIQTVLPDGSMHYSNEGLGFSKNIQAAAGYEFIPRDNLHIKAEAYYQYLYKIPVKQSIPQYSLLNQGHDFFLDREYSDSLVNAGTGVNTGIELTLEHFFSRNFFWLFTASLFDSKYSGYDSISRNTAFNVNYALNAAAGYEFVIGKRKWGVMSFGLRGTWTGGNPYIPYDVTQTMATGEPVYKWNDSFTVRYPEYQRYSVRFGIRRNHPGYNMEFLLDLQYRTNYTNVYLQRIDPSTGEIKTFFNMGFFPMGTWKIQF